MSTHVQVRYLTFTRPHTRTAHTQSTKARRHDEASRMYRMYTQQPSQASKQAMPRRRRKTCTVSIPENLFSFTARNRTGTRIRTRTRPQSKEEWGRPACTRACILQPKDPTPSVSHHRKRKQPPRQLEGS